MIADSTLYGDDTSGGLIDDTTEDTSTDTTEEVSTTSYEGGYSPTSGSSDYDYTSEWETDTTDSGSTDDGDYDSYGVRDEDQDVADGADETTGEVSGSGLVDAINDGDVQAGDLDPNAEVGGTDTQVDGDPADDPENTTGGLGEFNAGVDSDSDTQNAQARQAVNEIAQFLQNGGQGGVGDLSTTAQGLLAAMVLGGGYIALDLTGAGA